MRHFTAVSDGTGQILRGEVDVDEIQDTPPRFNSEGSNATRKVVNDPFANLPKYRDAKSIPSALASVFNKILEHERDSVTYRYRELSFMELLTLGTNPFMLEMLESIDGGEAVDTEQFVKEIQERDPDEVAQMTAEAKIHRDKVLLHSLVDIRAGDNVMEVDASVIATMQEPIRNGLYEVISGGATAETQAVGEFPENADSDTGGDDIPAGK